MNASGLPTLGSSFQISGYSGTDSWVWCRPELSVRIHQEREGDPAVYYLVEVTYSNKVESGQSRRCQNTSVDDPLMEPMKIGGSFGRTQWEAKYDKDGVRLVTSANEPITGPGVTFDYVRPTVRIEQNVANLGLASFANMVNTVNSAPLWGCPARCVKLANASWERRVYGKCGFFFTRSFEFEIDYYNCDKYGNAIGFDKEVYDSGSKCLRGKWITDTTDSFYGRFKLLSSISATDPSTILNTPESQFMTYKDMNNENARVFLDGYGRPANVSLAPSGQSGPPASAICRYYKESNFLLLGIPTSLS
jgi:hypothetical protein